MAFEGMDINEVRKMGHTMQTLANDIDHHMIQKIDGLVNQIPGVWRGPDATKFQGWWHEHRAQLHNAAKELHGLGQSAKNNATAQEHVSKK